MMRLRSSAALTLVAAPARNGAVKSTSLTMACLSLVFCASTALNSSAQTFTTLASFDSTNGANPTEALIQGLDGNFYGTASNGGANKAGTIYRVTPAGALTTVYNFCSLANCADGKAPLETLLLASDGNFYGTTVQGGANSYGTIFRVDSAGALTTLYSFCRKTSCLDGYFPEAGLIQAANGNFYGTTSGGGTKGFGTVFEMTPKGKLTTLYSFCNGTNQSNCGNFPQQNLIQASNGNFYGMTPLGGSNGWGTVFEVAPGGKETDLYHFEAGNPRGPLVQARNGSFWGMTLLGGQGSSGVVFQIKAGNLTNVYNFCTQPNCVDGANPSAGLIQASDANFYGSTPAGGVGETDCFGGCGTLFKITPAGTFTSLHSFCSQANCADGDGPYAGLLQATNGTFYGTAQFGGTSTACSSGCGTVFSLSTGLAPFVQPLSTSGGVGSKVILLGNNLSSTTSVTFNGTAATFHVVSDTEITANVPTGATSGGIEVTTSHGTLRSKAAFQMNP